MALCLLVFWYPNPKAGKQKDSSKGEKDLESSTNQSYQVVCPQCVQVSIAAGKFSFQSSNLDLECRTL